MEKKSPKRKISTKKSAKSKSKHSTNHDANATRDDTKPSENGEGEHNGDGDGGGGGGCGGTDATRQKTNQRSLGRSQSSMSMTGNRQITEAERKEIAEAFKFLDEDGDGKLGFDEMKKLLQSQFMSFTDAGAAEVIQQLDANGSGEIEFEEFENYVIDNNLCKPTVEEFNSEMKAAFEMFDSDNNGYIDAKEFQALMGGIGDKMSDDEIAELMKEADTNGDGFIDYKEFCMHMSKSF